MYHVPLILFAQKGPPPEAAAAAGLGVMFFFVCMGLYAIIIVAMMGLGIWYLITAFQALNACSPRNRDMEPGMVFLVFIPIFGPIWQFFVVLRVASSLHREYRSRDMRGDGDFGKTLGLWMLILPFTCVGGIASPILMIMYIMRVRAFTARLWSSGKSRRRDDDDEDD